MEVECACDSLLERGRLVKGGYADGGTVTGFPECFAGKESGQRFSIIPLSFRGQLEWFGFCSHYYIVDETETECTLARSRVCDSENVSIIKRKLAGKEGILDRGCSTRRLAAKVRAQGETSGTS